MIIELPYVVKPEQSTKTVGHKGVGVLEFPQYFALQENEINFIVDNEISVEKLAIDTAKRIVNEEIKADPVGELAKALKNPEKTPAKSVIDTANALLFKDYEFFVENLDTLLNFSKQQKHISRHEDIVLVTAIIKYRLVPDWAIENTKDGKLLNPGLLAELLKFARQEKAGLDEEGAQAEDENPTQPDFIDEEEEDVGSAIEIHIEAENPQEAADALRQEIQNSTAAK